ncbi:MAG: DUF1249 domain-containing protein [Salinisphaera sp.]|nr:DUF1249 domain-containing protein [Salinisphaera sp.]MDN5937126.1 DUF1249 domain-containing protein [Salinisphaera sp.]
MILQQQRRLLAGAQPRSFAGLMGLYESNFRRFVRMAPEIDLPFDAAVSRSSADRDLYLRVLERCKYTTTVHLTYWFDGEIDGQADPDLHIRLYRDAQLAEAVHCRTPSRYAALPNAPGHQPPLHSQWSRNLLLNKWLAFCLQQGHGFSTAHRPRRRAQA